MTPFREHVLADTVRLIYGDCREILPTLPRPGAIISDVPYGQKQKTNVSRRSASGRSSDVGVRIGDPKGRLVASGIHGTGRATLWPARIIGDDKPFDPAWLLDRADILLLWGHHRFGHRLPAGTLLVWDKVPSGKRRDQGDGEIAWLNSAPPRPLRIFRLLWDGLCVGPAARHEVTAGQPRLHPTQKPEALMSWCVEQARVPPGGVICDPYMGSGSTGVAAIRAGHPFVGIEREPLYFETALRRLTFELDPKRRFDERSAERGQQVLL